MKRTTYAVVPDAVKLCFIKLAVEHASVKPYSLCSDLITDGVNNAVAPDDKDNRDNIEWNAVKGLVSDEQKKPDNHPYEEVREV